MCSYRSRWLPFAEYESHPLAREAAADLTRLSGFAASSVDGHISSRTLFRGTYTGADRGPYVSQLLWLDTVYGPERLSRRMRTVRSGVDYATNARDWLALQNGNTPWPDQYDTTWRYI